MFNLRGRYKGFHCTISSTFLYVWNPLHPNRKKGKKLSIFIFISAGIIHNAVEFELHFSILRHALHGGNAGLDQLYALNC